MKYVLSPPMDANASPLIHCDLVSVDIKCPSPKWLKWFFPLC